MCLSSSFLNFLHSLGFNIYSLQGVQHPSPCDTLGFPPPSHSALFFPTSTLHTSSGLSVMQWLHLVSTCCESAPLGGIHLVSISKLRPRIPLSNSISCIHSLGQDLPSGLLTTFCMHFSLVSMSRLPLSLNNFLRSSGFNI